MVTLKADVKCAFEGCEKPATAIASGRSAYEWEDWKGHPDPDLYCEVHGEQVANEDSPRYTPGCPNCGCHFGVD